MGEVESGVKWWLRYVLVPLIGGGGLVALVLQLGPKQTPKPTMGPLLPGWNLEHNDLDAGGWVALESAEACSDLCYSRADCKAMTYVVSNKSCWLKYAAPTPTPNPDTISAVKN